MSQFEDPQTGNFGTALDHALNAHEAPPRDLRDKFKYYHFIKSEQLARDEAIIDFGALGIEGLSSIPEARLHELLERFLFGRWINNPREGLRDYKPCASVYSSQVIPGLLIIPSLFPPVVQQELLSRLLHRDLSNPDHQTNLNLHYDMTYPDPGNSFFSSTPSTVLFEPKDSKLHKRLSIKQVLEKKLRWITLGGQYDWTNKIYPAGTHPKFPKDIADLIEGLFPDMEAQAAIVNLYSPGDTLSLHRDVSETINRGLVSISLGCDCLFIVGLGDDLSKVDTRYVALRLRSGDAVYMSGEARFAWHGVPQIIPGTCPPYLSDWPTDKFKDWQGYMSNKRINLNVRQMRESSEPRRTHDYLTSAVHSTANNPQQEVI